MTASMVVGRSVARKLLVMASLLQGGVGLTGRNRTGGHPSGRWGRCTPRSAGWRCLRGSWGPLLSQLIAFRQGRRNRTRSECASAPARGTQSEEESRRNKPPPGARRDCFSATGCAERNGPYDPQAVRQRSCPRRQARTKQRRARRRWSSGRARCCALRPVAASPARAFPDL